MEPENIAESSEEESINFNVGGWYFSIPKSKLAQYPDSLLWKEASVQDQSENLRLFIDQDGFIFRHLHYYIQTSKLSFFGCAELNLLYEQALILQLTPLIQSKQRLLSANSYAQHPMTIILTSLVEHEPSNLRRKKILDNLKEEKYSLHVRPTDIPVAERTPLNYWRTRKCAKKPSEIPPKSPVFAGLHESAPLGLVDTPLLDTEEEVNYCFLPLDLVRKYPVLVNDDNLLWLLENAALIECEYSEFRFIVNFLRSEKILLPDDFSNIDALEEEVLILGIPELIEAVRIYRGGGAARRGAGGRRGDPGRRAPLFELALGLLAHYPDSALGQLRVGSDLGRRRLHVCGSGVLFQHARNWLGTCQLPLTEDISEIQELCAFLDKGDITYEPVKDALECYLKEQAPSESRGYNAEWTAEVSVCSLHQIVKVYVGSNWYETYLQTLLKYPELLSNEKKVCWITYGQSLLIHGDGQMFRHVLNFLRLGKLFLPAEFKEWPLFRQEAEEYQIPSLLEALHHCEAYRLWIQSKELSNEDSFPCRRLNVVPCNKEHEFSQDPKEVYPYAARDSSKNYVNTWSSIKDLKGKQDTNGDKAESSKLVPQDRGMKRKDALGGGDESSCSVVNSSLCLGSPPRKRGVRSSLTKPAGSEGSASHILRLISLVRERDTLNSTRCDLQHVEMSDGCATGRVPQHRAPEEDRGVQAPIAPGKMSFAPQANDPVTQCEFGAGGKQQEQDVFKRSLLLTPSAGTDQLSTIKSAPPRGKNTEDRNREPAEENFLGEVREQSVQMELIPPAGGGQTWLPITAMQHVKLQLYPFTEAPDGQQTKALEDHRSVGLILKVAHPPVLGSDGFHTCNEESVVYSVVLAGTQLGPAHPQALPEDVVFLRFALSHEEMFYARQCHFFLTDVILDSMRQQDPKEITARVAALVNRFWTRQITPKEFVGDLLSTEYFKGDRNVRDALLQWVEFTLPLAWKYGRCLEALLRRGLARSVSCCALGL